jgi:hypothetical protein
MRQQWIGTLGLLAALSLLGLGATSVRAQDDCPCQNNGGYAATCSPWRYGQNSLFHNYYVPGVCGGVPAAMYVSPMPVPAVVGHTYITNEAFMPHEQMHNHHKKYYRYTNDGRGLTRTSVHWYSPPFKNAARTGLNAIRIAR